MLVDVDVGVLVGSRVGVAVGSGVAMAIGAGVGDGVEEEVGVAVGAGVDEGATHGSALAGTCTTCDCGAQPTTKKPTRARVAILRMTPPPPNSTRYWLQLQAHPLHSPHNSC